MEKERMPKRMMEMKYVEKRPQGRTRKKWEKQITESVQVKGEEWWKDGMDGLQFSVNKTKEAMGKFFKENEAMLKMTEQFVEYCHKKDTRAKIRTPSPAIHSNARVTPLAQGSPTFFGSRSKRQEGKKDFPVRSTVIDCPSRKSEIQ
ncbi:unnamed protein product [Timema podura]|uniref:Uncharacterized protein n=1 Tax=Timema podura TaxID=61482 RepID=A0ABN7P641_TIMPD|nr:unnamed protein product [Timema podura]